MAGKQMSSPAPAAEKAGDMSTADTKVLARLVAKYGRKPVVEAAKRMRVRRPCTVGRPSAEIDRIKLADWIDYWAQQYRDSGSRMPITAAELRLYRMMSPSFEPADEDDAAILDVLARLKAAIDAEKLGETGRVEKWQKKIKNLRLQGRKESADVQERHAQARRRSGPRRD